MEEENLQFPEVASASLPTSESLGIESLTPQMATADMPEAWGGRPTGTTRRSIRMQKAWDDQRKIMMAEREEARRQYEFGRSSEILARKQAMDESRYDREMEEYSAKQKLEAQKEFESQAFTSLLNKLDPSSDDFNDQLVEGFRLYPLASIVPEVKATVDEYRLANSVYRDSKKEQQKDQETEEAFRVQQEATAAKLGIDTDAFVSGGQVDRVGLMRKIGEAQREELESKEQNINQAKLDEETKSQANALTKDMRDLNDEIELKTMQAERMKGRLKEEAMVEVEALNRRYDRRVSELDELTLPRLTKEDKEAFDGLPEGAEFFLDGRKVRKPKSQKSGTVEPVATPESTPKPEPVSPVERTAPAAPRPEPTPETVAPEAMLRDMSDEEVLGEELDRLYKLGYKFSPNKKQRDLYTRVSTQLKESRTSKNKQKYQRVTEIRKRMNDIGSFNSDPALREEYSRLQQEREVLLGA